MRFAKKVLLFSVIVIITYFLGMRLFSIGRLLFFEYSIDSKPGTDIEFTITKDDNIDTIAEKLFDDGLIDNTTVFKFRAIGYKINFTPNTYKLNTSMTIKNILTIFDKNIAIEESTVSTENPSP
jgi:cell division protein YceG involved in septum cleavage